MKENRRNMKESERHTTD